MLPKFSGVEFWKTASKFRKRKRKSLSCVHVLDKTWNWAFSRRSRAVRAKKCTKKHDARAELLFANLNLLLFYRSRWRRRRCYLSSLISDREWLGTRQITAGLPSYCSNTLLHEKSGEEHPSKISLCSKTTTKGAYYNKSHTHSHTHNNKLATLYFVHTHLSVAPSKLKIQSSNL